MVAQGGSLWHKIAGEASTRPIRAEPRWTSTNKSGENWIQVTSKTKGVRMEKLDFPGSQYDFRPIDMAFSFDGLVNLDLGFNFLDRNIRDNNKKWHYPCVAKLECEAQVEQATDYLALAMVLGQW